MAITKASSNAVAAAAKGDLVVGNATNDSGVLGVGANNTVLTADSAEATGLKWAAPGGAGANWTLLNTGGTTLSGFSTTVSGISGADKIFIIVDLASASGANSAMRLTFNGNGSSVYNQFGPKQNIESTYASAIFSVESGNNSRIELGAMASSASSNVTAYLEISGCNSSGLKMFTMAGAGTQTAPNAAVAYFTGGYFDSSSTISSVTIASSNSAFDNGKVYVYTSA